MGDVGRAGAIDGGRVGRWRVHAQHLGELRFGSVADVVHGLLGVQAENHGHASWAVAARTHGIDLATFERAFDEGKILRTHVFRPTWHYVHPDDIRWLLELTAPRIRRSFRQLQRSLEVSDGELERSRQVLAESLAGGTHLTRAALGDRLQEAGLRVGGSLLGLYAADAELDGLVCSGATKDGEQTYALLEERAPRARRREPDEALGELVLRYFSGHGPATERDLAYWATLTATDVRRGLAVASDGLESFEQDGRRYWFAEPPPTAPPEPRGHLLLVLDELYRGYQDSRRHIDAAGIQPAGREASIGMSLVDGQIVGGMRRSTKGRSVRFEVLPFRDLDEDERTVLAEAAGRYGAFLGLDPEVLFTDRRQEHDRPG